MEPKIVHAHVYNPQNALFKSNRNDKAECQIITCYNSGNCGLFNRGECATLTSFGFSACPYGKKSFETGFTPKAMAFNKWISDRKDKYKDQLGKLKSYQRKMALVGEYVFLPYAHLNMNRALPFKHHGSAFSSGDNFIELAQFNVELIMSIINFYPQAMMGGEIVSYQREVVPKFVAHLREVFPDRYSDVVKHHPYIANIVSNLSPVGRKALLNTLRPGVIVTKYHDTPKLNTQHWVWDGEYLTSTNAGVSFPIVDYDECTIRIKPKPNVSVQITSEDQVDDDTKYTD